MSGQIKLKLENVWAKYDGTPALENISLELYEGDFLGVIGPNGAGKTTLLKVMLGLLKPYKGKVTVYPKNCEDEKSFLGYVPQQSHFDRDFPINVFEVALMGQYSHKGAFSRYNAEDKKAAEEALQKVGMYECKDRQIGALSGGQQQRVLIARALASKPQILLLDEPIASVDAAMQADFYELLEELKRDMAIIMVSHDIGAISVHVNKIACINRCLYYHGSGKIDADILEKTYKCPVQMITHGDVPHRVLKGHK